MAKGPKYNLLSSVLSEGRLNFAEKGQVITSSDQGLVISLISSGFVKRYLIDNSGQLGVQGVYGPGNIFPVTLAFKILFDQSIYEGPEVYHYEAMCRTKIYSLSILRFKEKVQKDPRLYRDLLRLTGQRLQLFILQKENISLRSSYQRVAHQILSLANEFGTPSPNGIYVPVPLTQQDLADMLSATRETVSICMSQLRKKGLITTGKELVVPDIDKLREEAYS